MWECQLTEPVCFIGSAPERSVGPIDDYRFHGRGERDFSSDFMAGQSFERIGTPRVLARLLFVSTLVLTVYMLY